MLWQKEKSQRNLWKISNGLTKKTKQLHENPSKFLSYNCWIKKTLKKITISELVERAGVSRAAFYRNYGSKEEILKSVFESSIAKITKSLDGYNLKTDLYQVWVYLLKEVKKEAKISAVAAIVPVPLMDLVVDAGLLTKLLPQISEKFGLIEPAEKVVDLDNKDKLGGLKDQAVDIAGLVLTRIIVKKTFQGFGGRIIAKQVTKFIPFGGQIVAGTIGYLMFKKIADDHINQCYQQALKLKQANASKTVN